MKGGKKKKMEYMAFRACRTDELEALKAGDGLKALAPGCDRYSIADHIRNGGLQTRYLSASRNPLAGVKYLADGAPLIIVGITKPYDIDAAAEADTLFPVGSKGKHSPAYHYAKKSDEVIYIDFVDAEYCNILVDGTQWTSKEPTDEERAVIVARFGNDIAWIDHDTDTSKHRMASKEMTLAVGAEKALAENNIELFRALAHLAVSALCR